MKQKLFYKVSIYILFLFLSLNLYSKNFMWEVKSNSTTIYLLGSIHVGKSGTFPLNNVIENAFTNSSNLVVEVDIDSINPMSLMKYMVYSDSNTLQSNLKPEVYNNLIKMLGEIGLPELLYTKLKPWAAVMMAQQFSMKESGVSAENGIDKYFIDKARGNKKIISLETAEYQMSILEEFDKVSNEFVEYSLKDFKNENDQIDNMFKAWKNGNESEIEKIINEEENDFPSYKSIMEKLLYNRNINMTSKINEWLKGNVTYFVVVGAGHLVGNRGIVNLLRKNKELSIIQK